MKARTLLSGMLVALLALVFIGCAGSGEVYSTQITDGETYEEAVLPASTIDGAYAWNMMGMTLSTITLTLDGEEYTYKADDLTTEDTSSGQYYHKVRTYSGTFTRSGNRVTLSVPTDISVETAYGEGYAEYSDIWGEQGTFGADHEEGQKAMGRWVGGVTAIVSEDGSLSFE